MSLGALSSPSSANPGGSSPVTYTPAREGLPKGKIWKSQMAFGDINGDGFADLGTISRLADGPYVWRGDGKGNWVSASNGLPRETFCGGGMAFADANNDGNTDVAIADHCKGVFVFHGDGQGNWKTASAGLPTEGSEDIAVGDFNQDKCLDVAIVTTESQGVRAFKGNCKGAWTESSTGLPHEEWGNGIEMADVDADGNLDIIAAYAAGPRVWRGDGKGNWTEASEGLPAPEIHGLYWGIAVGDVNGDGKLDVASGAAVPGVEVFIQEKGEFGPKWRRAIDGIVPMNALGVAFGDLDKDGNTDLVVAGKTNLEEIGGVYGIIPFFGDGQGKWTLRQDTELPMSGRERTWGVGLPDIDGDGVLDVAAAFGDVLNPSWRSGPKIGAEVPATFRKGFGKLKPGMSVDEVEKELGEDVPTHGFFSGFAEDEYEVTMYEHFKLRFSNPAFGSDKLVETKGPEKRGAPERGYFGAIEVWRGTLSK
jgi:hypothetical protein